VVPALGDAYDVQRELVGLKRDLEPARRRHLAPGCDLAAVELAQPLPKLFD
jgi:hypothetical protein